MERTTVAQLQHAVDNLNRLTKSPLTSWTRVDGHSVANVGNYHLDGAYGGYALARMMNEHGGITSIINGYRPKRELMDLIRTYSAGVYDCQEAAGS